MKRGTLGSEIKPPINPDYSLWRLLSSTYRRIDHVISKNLRKAGITSDIAGILYLVDFLDNNGTPSDIARLSARSPQTITSRLDVMINRGLLTKTRDEQKQNMYRISLTNKGKRAFRKSIEVGRYHRIMSALTETERQTLTECLEKLRAQAKKMR